MENNKIVYIEDEEDYQKLVTCILQEAGFSVTVAGTGEEGLRLLDRERPGLLLLDINLPDMDGFSICRRLRTEERWRDLPVLMLTVRRRPEEWRNGFSCGANDYLSKPFNPPDLLERVEAGLHGKSVRPVIGPDEAEYQMIQAALSGNRAAFDVLVRQFREPLSRSLSQQLRNKAAVEDIVSSTFSIAFEKMKDFQGQSSFQTYLHGIAMRLLKRYWRDSSARPTVDLLGGEEGEWLSEEDPGLEGILRDSDRPKIQDVVSRLPAPDRKLLEWSVVRNMPHDVIAERLDVPTGTVWSRVSKAKKLFRDAWTVCSYRHSRLT
jgi:RNA polymerase sigma factor (sigma-70 family)